MFSRSPVLYLLSSLLGVALAAFPSEQAHGQEDNSDPVVAYNKTISHIQLENWDEGLKTVNQLITERGEGAMNRYGPVFGHFYFLKGILLLGKEDFPGAIASFKTCYEKFDNKILETAPEEETKNMRPNEFLNAALVQWANAEMKLESYDSARDLYEKVLKEGANDKKVNKIFVGVNLGRCYLKSGQLEKGYEFMSKPLENEKLSDGLRETVMMVVSEDWSPERKFEEVQGFLNQFKSLVDTDPFAERYQRNPRFQYLAQVAIQQNDPVRALAWYERMVDPRHLRAEMERQYSSLENRFVAEELESKKREMLTGIQTSIEALEEDYIKILNGIGSAHFQLRNFSGSFAAFSRLSDEAGAAHEERPVFLHNAVVSAVQVERWKEGYHYGKQFLSEFPEHELKPGVAKVLVEVLFLREEYGEAYSVAGEVREGMEPGSEIRDIPDFVYSASAFHLEKIDEAELELGNYVKNYPKGERLEFVRFFLGLTKVRLSKWEEAVTVLNSFLKDYPDSALVSTVLFQCAMSEFMLDQTEASLAKVDRIHSEFPNAESAAPAWNLRGDIYASEERSFEEVEASYVMGRDRAVEAGQDETAAYAIWQLVVNTVGVEEWEKASGHYDDFQAGHADSVYRYDLIAAALPVLVAGERQDEGLEQLKAVVWEYRDQPESPVLGEMFGTFIEFLKENYEPEIMQKEIEGFTVKKGVTPTLKGWLTVAKTDLLESQEVNQEEINKDWYRLEAGFKPEAQSNFVIVSLARWISDIRKKPAEAKPLYDFILSERPGTPNFEHCLIDVAEIQAASGEAEQIAEAIEKFEKVMAEVPVEELRERAVLGMARIRMEEANYEAATKWWETYLETREWTLSRAEA
ncbi:tetratricopeptide repeat protein, partial [Verrucomicrobiales bacterium]|nr:tetratricopeptide repeat protein [Verrucomicrobiales bacterium]